jgi:hypothetical protein
MQSNQNAYNNRTQGMSPHVRMFFQGGTKNGKEESSKEEDKEEGSEKEGSKKESNEEESNEEENCQEEKIGLRIVQKQFESRHLLAAFFLGLDSNLHDNVWTTGFLKITQYSCLMGTSSILPYLLRSLVQLC